jgi:leader peptidase (prepilin peptidase)/N-methyltransferase
MSEAQRLLFVGWAGLLGLVVGSFLNVCIFRLPRNCMSIVKPRSRCPKCLRFIAWYDNLPVASWLVLGGKCRHCRNPISPRYLLIELLTGALYAYAAWAALYPPVRPLGAAAALFLVQAWLIGALIVCTFIDFDFRILPDEITLPGIPIGLALSFAFPFLPFFQGTLSDLASLLFGMSKLLVDPYKGLPELLRMKNALLGWEEAHPHWMALGASALGALTGFGVIWLVGQLGKILFRKRIARAGETEAMGFGDVKYMAMLGAALGWKGVLLTLVLG